MEHTTGYTKYEHSPSGAIVTMPYHGRKVWGKTKDDWRWLRWHEVYPCYKTNIIGFKKQVTK